ncbi:MAG: class I SAM-dependent methyltransferase [Nocardioidaceae bacterium]
MTQDSKTRDYWDSQAAAFDEKPDHGLLDPETRLAWADLLLSLLPSAPARVADLGCGTGSLSVLLGLRGYRVYGVDLSAQMLVRAKAKAVQTGVTVQLFQGDAAQPPLAGNSCDVVLVRHVLWALQDPEMAIASWAGLLRPGGMLVLIEGRWHTGGGLAAVDAQTMVLRSRQEAMITPLEESALWGGDMDDERYVLVSAR